MAIVQISQITNRLGLQADLPQLAGGELGWSTDTRQLYIGNGTLAEGAPVVGNTELLTEFSDILNVASSYTYKGNAATGYAVQTGPTPGSPVVQSLQNWMDQFASVKDFGAKGDGVADDTAAINRALQQLYCQQQNPQIRRSLFFPAGVYIVSSTINIPTYAMLYGEGIDASIIQLTLTGAGSYVAQTADSKQQTGTNIGANGGTPPTGITIANMGFASINPTPSIFLVQSASDCEFQRVSFTGPGTKTTLVSATLGTAGVNFGSTPSLVTTNILFNDCKFSGTTYGVYTDQQIKGVTVTNSRFDTLNQGVGLGQGSPVNGGPTGTRITNNNFDNIYAAGIVIGPVSLNATGYNIFYDVAGSFQGINISTASIIEFLGNNNVSIGDMFARSNTLAQTSGYPQVNIHDTLSIATTNGSQIQMGTKVVQSGTMINLPDGQAFATAFNVNTANTSITSFKVDYSITQGTAYRVGSLMVTGQGTGNVALSEDYTENKLTNILFYAAENSNIISISYSTLPSSGSNGTMSYSISYFN